MHEKILFVDDEPAVLKGFKRALRNEFQPDTALSVVRKPWPPSLAVVPMPS